MDPPLNNYNLAMRQLGLKNPKRLAMIHDIFDKQCMKIKRKIFTEKEEDLDRLNNRKEQWKIPYRVIAFLANRIQILEEDPSIIENYVLIEWDRFKEIMFDIYDHRIQNAPELNGGVNTSHCSMNEHFLMYFVDLYRKRDLAELKIVDFIINLRYYYDNWQRARIFACNLEFVYFPMKSALE